MKGKEIMNKSVIASIAMIFIGVLIIVISSYFAIG